MQILKKCKMELNLVCEKGTRGSTFVHFLNLEISGETYGFCLQKGQNTLELVQTLVYKDGYIYR